MTIRPDNDFIRPKWGIYRSLLAPSDLRDEAVRFNSFSITEQSSLPVQLASFTGAVVNNAVRLEWRTISEVNNYGFHVEKRSIGVIEWWRVENSFVAGHGTTNEPHSYSFVDSTASRGSWQYRLKQVDLDGSIHFTEPIRVDVVAEAEGEVAPMRFELHQNYPNPFNPTTTIRFTIPVGTGHVPSLLKVYDVLGKEVVTLVNEELKPGSYERVFDASAVPAGMQGLASGTYFSKLQSGSQVQIKKMLFVR
ncbi:MAG: T9SS type A sorting domain-containing protein [Ignavibacteriae bacterium]|nr:T9SS type A sorting domain-containing protein [Ignavibacteriota bacterium]